MVDITARQEDWMSEEFEKGLVSVIIPTYNRANILTDALDSVWAQTYRPIELIVVDDGSGDSTDEVFERWRGDHQGDDQFELRYFHQENSGAPSARNLGLIQSKGEYIQFLDSDDVLYPTMLAQVVRAFEATHYGFVHVGYDKICNECGRILYSHTPKPETDALKAYLYERLWGHTTSIVRRRSLAREIGPWDESLVIDQDGDYMVRTILRSPRMTVVSDKLYAYLVRRGSKINDRKGSREAWLCRLQRESKFCEAIKVKEGLSSEAKGAYAERLYKLALSHYNAGIPEIGTAFGDLAEGIQGAALTGLGRFMQRSWRSGRRAFAGYEWLREKKHQIRRFLSGKPSKESACSVCGG